MFPLFSPPTCFHTDSVTTHTSGHFKCKLLKRCEEYVDILTPSFSLRLTVIGRVEATEEADGGDPAVHVLLGLGHQIPGPLLRLQVEHEAALQLLLCERQAGIHLKEKEVRCLNFTWRQTLFQWRPKALFQVAGHKTVGYLTNC